MPVTPAPSESELAERLAVRTLELIDIPSESRHEAELAAHVASVLREGGAVVEDLGDSCVLAYPSDMRPQVLLAGHLDTVPAQGNIPGRIADGRVTGLGASDMLGALAVMMELVLARAPYAALFFPREELPANESALAPLLERHTLRPGVRRRDGADGRRVARGLPREHQRDVDVLRALRALRAAVAGRQRDPHGGARHRRAGLRAVGAGDGARADVPRGRLRHARGGRDRGQRDPRVLRRRGELPLRPGPDAARGRAAAARDDARPGGAGGDRQLRAPAPWRWTIRSRRS